MSEKRNARFVGATTERAEAATLGGVAASSNRDCTTSVKVRQVHEILLQGAENAIEGATLAAALGFKDRRALSKQIERERRSGQPICASVAGNSRGYYLADDPGELQRYIRALDRRIREIRKTRDACGETFRRMTGQEVLAGWQRCD